MPAVFALQRPSAEKKHPVRDITLPYQTEQCARVVRTGNIIAQPGSVLVFVFNPPQGNTTSVSGAIGNSFVARCSGKTRTRFRSLLIDFFNALKES